MIETNLNIRQLMALSAQADELAHQFTRKKITDVEYIGKLNALRQQYDLPPIDMALERE